MTLDTRIPLSALSPLAFDPVGLYCYDRGFNSLLVSYGGELCYLEGYVAHPLRGFAPSVDAQDASTRDRLARWLAARLDVKLGSSAPEWLGGPDGWRLLGQRSWTGNLRRFAPDAPSTRLDVLVPSLSVLNPIDEARLPDGSRVVDAVALKCVILHLGGAA